MTRFTRARAVAAAAGAVLALGLVAPMAFADDGPWNIDGNIPDSGTTNLPDKFGNVKELGPLNSNTTKIGVIHNDALPTLGLTNPNANVDLTQAWLGTAKASGTNHDWLYFAWERDSNNGSGFIAYEFMQNAAPSGCAYDTATDAQLIADCNPWANRDGDTDGAGSDIGDFMILWDQQGNSQDLYLRKWTGTAPNLTLGAPTLLNSAVSEAEYNSDFTRGEAAVDLTATIFGGSTTCTTFANTIPSTVTGNSDTADYKDTILKNAPPITNCGTVTIIKQTNPRGVNQNFSFTSTLAGSQISCTTDTTPAGFNLNDNGNSGTANSTGNTETCTNVPAGSYTVTEGTDPTGFAFASLTCSASGTGTSVTPTSSTSNKTASITMAGGGSVTCTYVNDQQKGAIKVTKTSTKGNTGLAGATFSITSGGTAITGSPFQTSGTAGTFCVDNLAFGSYVVTETAAPTGYAIDDTTGHTVTVDNNASCSDTVYVGETTSFTDTPLSSIQVKFTSLAGAGVTKSSIVCTKASVTVAPVSENGSADPAYDDTDETITNLTPGVYTCTVDVDP